MLLKALAVIILVGASNKRKTHPKLYLYHKRMGLLNFFSRQSAEPALERSTTVLSSDIVSHNEMLNGYADRVDRLSVVYGCINRRASTVAQLPLKVYQKMGETRVEATDSIYFNLLTKRPNGFQTPFQFWSWVSRQVDLYGNCYVKRIRNGLGQTIELLPLSPAQVEVGINTNDGSSKYKIDGVPYDNTQIVHFKSGYSADGLIGLSAIELFRVLFDGYGILENVGTEIARNAAKSPNAVMHPANLKEDELKKLKAGWDAGFRGANSGKTAWLPNTFDVKNIPNGLSAQDAQYIEQKKFNAQRICSDIFGVPQHMLGLTSNPTYGSVEQMALEYVQYTIQPILINFEQTINNTFFADSDVYVKFAVNGLLRGDVNTRINAYKFYLEHGVMTPNHINAMEDNGIVVPVEQGGDTYVRPLNIAPSTTNQPLVSAAT